MTVAKWNIILFNIFWLAYLKALTEVWRILFCRSFVSAPYIISVELHCGGDVFCGFHSKWHVFRWDAADFASVFSTKLWSLPRIFLFGCSSLSFQTKITKLVPRQNSKTKNQFQFRILMIYVLFLQKKQTKFNANRFPWLTNSVDWKRCRKNRAFRGSRIIGRFSLIHRYNVILIKRRIHTHTNTQIGSIDSKTTKYKLNDAF